MRGVKNQKIKEVQTIMDMLTTVHTKPGTGVYTTVRYAFLKKLNLTELAALYTMIFCRTRKGK